jgi:hypothetical protein
MIQTGGNSDLHFLCYHNHDRKKQHVTRLSIINYFSSQVFL